MTGCELGEVGVVGFDGELGAFWFGRFVVGETSAMGGPPTRLTPPRRDVGDPDDDDDEELAY